MTGIWEFLQSYGIWIFFGALFLFMMRAHGHGRGGCGMGGHSHHEQKPEEVSGKEQVSEGKRSRGCH